MEINGHVTDLGWTDRRTTKEYRMMDGCYIRSFALNLTKWVSVDFDAGVYNLDHYKH